MQREHLSIKSVYIFMNYPIKSSILYHHHHYCVVFPTTEYLTDTALKLRQPNFSSQTLASTFIRLCEDLLLASSALFSFFLSFISCLSCTIVSFVSVSGIMVSGYIYLHPPAAKSDRCLASPYRPIAFSARSFLPVPESSVEPSQRHTSKPLLHRNMPPPKVAEPRQPSSRPV